MPAVFRTMKITHLDGTEVICHGKPRDIVDYEHKFKGPLGMMFNENGMFQEHMWFFAWCAERRVNADLPDFETWLDDLDSVEIIEESTENPSEPSPSPSQ